MDLKEFATDFMESITLSASDEETNLEEALTEGIIEYISDAGEVNAPDICSFRKAKAALHAIDYNVDGNSLDLFILIQPDSFLGKINSNKVDNGFNKLYQLYREAINGTLVNPDDATDEINEIVDLIQSSKCSIDTIRMYVLTNGLVETNYAPSTVELDDGLILEQNVWDMQRVYQQDRIRTGKEKIEIDFPTVYNTQLQCLKMNVSNPDIDGYLAIIPGITLAQIYKNYKQALLEQNVRTFLQFKAKVNRGIRDTLRECPDMFFSFNNGISTTASDIELEEIDGSLYIVKLHDWQIVNGGQTTASIAATYSEKGIDLSKVFVPMKISVIRDKGKINDIVPRISTSANLQTAVKQSDFSANDEFLVSLENLSRQTWVPNGNSKSVTKWYFERTRGQYLDDLSHQSGFNEKQFKLNYPKSHKLTKTDIAKFVNSWEQRPDLVCKGAEYNYLQFVKDVKSNSPIVSEVYYKRLVAKAILYKYIDKAVKDKKLGGYKANLNCYLMSSLSFISKKRLDFDYIWENQAIQDKLSLLIDNLIPIVWTHITEPKSTRSQNANINEWTKKVECWNSLKLELDKYNEFPDDLCLAPEAMIDDTLSIAQKGVIEDAWQISSETWFKISAWAKANNQLTPLQRKMAFSFGKSKSWNKMFTLKQAMAGIKIMKTVKDNGFIA